MEDAKRRSRQIPRKLQLFVFQRDRWLCRFCGKPVVFAPALKYLQQELLGSGFKNLAYWRYAYDRHGAPLLDELAAVIDHEKAFSLGGPNTIENLNTCCNRCNIMKNAGDSEEWQRKHPKRKIKAKYGEPQDWDGFSSVFVFLAKRNPSLLKPSESEWLRLLVRP